MVDSRIDRLQPKIKQFFNALNRPLFNTRVSKFLNFLLNRSSIQNNQLVLPEPVHPFVTHIPTTTFTVIQRQTELFPVHTSQSNTYTEDPQKRDIQCRAYKTETAKPGRSVDFAHPGPKEIPERYPFIEIVFPDSRRKSGRYTTGADCHLSAHQSI